MSLTRLARLAASAGVTAGLAFGGLATVGATSADAASTATVDATYSCSSPVLSGLPVLGDLFTFDVPATLTLSNLPDVLTDNIPVPAGTPISGTLDLSNLSATGLTGLITQLQLTLTQLLGGTPAAPVAVSVNNLLSSISGNLGTFQGTLGSFTPTSDLPLPIPTELNFGLLTGLLGSLGINCQLNRNTPVTITNSNGTTTSVGIAKQGSKIKAHVKRQGHKAVVKVKVKTTAGQKAVGQIMAKISGQKAKTKTLKSGAVKLTFQRLKAGKSKIKVKYLGNDYTNAAKKNVKVTVRSAR